MTLPQGFRILAESRNYLLGNIYEYGSIIDKRNQKETYIGDSYGDPDFGLIDKNENWALLFGHESYLWTSTAILSLNAELFECKEIFEWPFDARQVGDFEVEILDDPWTDHPGVYNFDIKKKSVKRIRDFKKLAIPYNVDNNPKIVW